MILASPDATRALGRQLASVLEVGDVVALSGPLGAGKTLLTRGIVEGLGFQDDVPSPSFPIVITYDVASMRLPLTHVDLYRVDDDDALDELGLDDARGVGAVVVEWPQRLIVRGWRDMLELSLEPFGEDARRLTAKPPTAWEARWPPR